MKIHIWFFGFIISSIYVIPSVSFSFVMSSRKRTGRRSSFWALEVSSSSSSSFSNPLPNIDSTWQYQEYERELKRLVQITSKDPLAVERAQHLVDQMLLQASNSSDNNLQLDTNIYNKLIEAHTYSKQPDSAETAEEILISMENGAAPVIPNSDTYGLVMQAWILRQRLDKVEELFERSPKDVTSYNKLIKAYGVAKEPEKAVNAWNELRESGITPNDKTWIHILRSQVDVGIIQSFLQLMNVESHITVDAQNALLRVLSRNKEAKAAESKLYEMIQRFREDGNEQQRPNDESFFHVILALRGDTEKGTSFKVEKLLELQNVLAPQASRRNLIAAMSVIAKTRDPKKAAKVEKLMDSIKSMKDVPSEELLRALTIVLQSCAYTRSSNLEDRLNAFQTAVDIFNDIRQSSLPFDGTIYGLLLKSCRLMPATPKRDAVVEKFFTECCKQGLASNQVTREFEKSASDTLQLKLLGGFLEDGVQPPVEWSRNV